MGRRVKSRRAVETFQQRFKRWREASGHSLQEVADKVNARLGDRSHLQVGRTTVLNYEKNTTPRVEWLVALKEAYPRINIEWLLFGTGKMMTEDDTPTDDEMFNPENPRYWYWLETAEYQNYFDAMDKAGFAGRDLPGSVVKDLQDFVFGAFDLNRFNFELPRDLDLALRTGILRGDFCMGVTRMFFTPDTLGDKFVKFEELSDVELQTYTYAFLAALRPLVRSLREDKTRSGQRGMDSAIGAALLGVPLPPDTEVGDGGDQADEVGSDDED